MFKRCTKKIRRLKKIILRKTMLIMLKILCLELRKKISDNCKNLYQPRDLKIHLKSWSHLSKKLTLQKD